jgi:hypothetical protein
MKLNKRCAERTFNSKYFVRVKRELPLLPILSLNNYLKTLEAAPVYKNCRGSYHRRGKNHYAII